MSSPSPTIHLDYPLGGESLPPPAPGTTRFVFLSDTHSATFPVPAGDVLLHAGDLTRRGTTHDLRRTMAWLCRLPHAVKIIIAGNRDFALHREWYDVNWERFEDLYEPPDPIQDLLTGAPAVAAHIVYLRDAPHRFRVRPGGREWSVYGSPQTPNYKDRIRAFGYDEGDAETVVKSFPQTDILLTHGPPHGILDLTVKNTHAGCPALSARLPSLRPTLHVFGHIHEARGAYLHRWDDGGGDGGAGGAAETLFVNAANWPAHHGHGELRGEPGGVGRQPVVVDLPD